MRIGSVVIAVCVVCVPVLATVASFPFHDVAAEDVAPAEARRRVCACMSVLPPHWRSVYSPPGSSISPTPGPTEPGRVTAKLLKLFSCYLYLCFLPAACHIVNGDSCASWSQNTFHCQRSALADSARTQKKLEKWGFFSLFFFTTFVCSHLTKESAFWGR